jgi:3-hydroxyacyl-CoA dehydrogenase
MSQINKIGVIGAGNMGSGIAQKIAQEGLNVVIVDIRDEYVKRGLGIIKQLLGEGLEPDRSRRSFPASPGQPILAPWPMRTLSSRRSSKTSR